MSGVFCGAAAGGTLPMTLSANFTSPSGASPQTTSAPTVNVPGGNSGNTVVGLTGTGAASISYSKNGAAFLAIVDGDGITFAQGDTISFRMTGSARTASITLRDNTTQYVMGTSTITNS